MAIDSRGPFGSWEITTALFQGDLVLAWLNVDFFNGIHNTMINSRTPDGTT